MPILGIHFDYLDVHNETGDPVLYEKGRQMQQQVLKCVKIRLS